MRICLQPFFDDVPDHIIPGLTGFVGDAGDCLLDLFI
jgi:hypothetical protein